MNRGHVLQSSPVQQMMAGGPNSWWNISNMRPPPPPQTSPFLAPAPSHLFPQFPSQLNSSSWHHDNQDQLPESWNQLLLGGLVGEEDKSATSSLSNMHAAANKLERWEEQLLSQSSSNGTNNSMVDIVKQENSAVSYGAEPSAYSCHGNTAAEFLQATKPTWSPVVVVNTNNNNIVAGAAGASSPRSSCVTSLSSNILDFSSNNKADGRHPPPERSSECNSTATGGAVKKARVQPSATQSTFKVRKEKLGDRITSLHQLVSPFGKTDTASVLLEAIGYIRFLQSQIEALSLPYFGNGSANLRHQQSGQGERNCLFPEDPGQLLNDNCMKIRKGASELQNQDSAELEPKKDLRSRGLCLVPVSCTMQVGSDNGADYWAPALSRGFR